MKRDTLQRVEILVVIMGFITGGVLFLIFDFAFGKFVISHPPMQKLEDTPYLRREFGWYELRSEFSGLYQWGGLRYPVATDQFGFRKDVHSQTSSRYDVIFLGDSFTFGINGAWEETFVGMYARSSKRAVINAGVSSYSPTAYIYQYQKALSAGLLRIPHTIVVGIDMSDVKDEAGHWIDGEQHPRKRDEELIYRKNQASRASSNNKPTTFVGYMKANLLLTRSIYRYLGFSSKDTANRILNLSASAFTYADWNQLNQKYAYEGEGGYAPLGVQGGLEKVELKLKELAEVARTNDARLFFLIYPWPAQLHHKDKFSWSAYVQDICKRLLCDGVIDTIPTFRRLARDNKAWYVTYYVFGDQHFNEAGNRIIANEIQAVLRAD